MARPRMRNECVALLAAGLRLVFPMALNPGQHRFGGVCADQRGLDVFPL